jgi:hypothetical protein
MNLDYFERERERLRVRMKVIWDENRENGKCGKCGGEPAIGKDGKELVHCEECRKAVNARTKLYKQNRRKNGSK